MPSDLIDVMIRLMESDETIVGPINIGNPAEYTILELARQVIALSGSSSKLIFRPLLRTIQNKGGPTSAKRGTSWDGSRKFLWKKGLKKQSLILQRAAKAIHIARRKVFVNLDSARP